jgi:hypothetical protein
MCRAFGSIGVAHLFGWGKRPINHYKAFDCFCRANKAGCAAATHNRAVCRWLGYGCKQNKDEAVAALTTLADSKTPSLALRCLSLVCSSIALVLRRFFSF